MWVCETCVHTNYLHGPGKIYRDAFLNFSEFSELSVPNPVPETGVRNVMIDDDEENVEESAALFLPYEVF